MGQLISVHCAENLEFIWIERYLWIWVVWAIKWLVENVLSKKNNEDD